MKQINWRQIVFIHCALGILSLGCGKPNIGIKDGRLMPCPGSPNCVSSYETDGSHYIELLKYTESREMARDTLLAVLKSLPRASVVQATDDYIHAEFTSKIFRFVDDVEFQFVEAQPFIQVRSASRIGYSDLGVNRKRMDEIRKLFYEKMGMASVEK